MLNDILLYIPNSLTTTVFTFNSLYNMNLYGMLVSAYIPPSGPTYYVYTPWDYIEFDMGVIPLTP